MENESRNDSVGGNIRRFRKERGWTQAVLASKTCIARESISKYENGSLTPTPENLTMLEQVFHIPAGTLQQKVAIAIPDTSALLRNRRLISLLLEDYSQVIIARDVSLELSAFKNRRLTSRSSGKERRQKRIASQTISLIEDYAHKYKGRVLIKDTRHYDVSGNHGVSESDQRILELARDEHRKTGRVVDIIQADKDMPLLADFGVHTIGLETYMAKRSRTESHYQTILDLDMEYHHLDQYVSVVDSLDLNTFLPDGMTLLISCIRCNEPEKVDERGGSVIPEHLIQNKIRFLLDHGADPDKPDSHSYCHTPLEHCIERHEPDWKEFLLLLESGADYNKSSVDETQPGHKRIPEINEGNTPLMIACWLGRERYVKELCKRNDLCINAQDVNGYTALMKCAVQRWNQRNEGRPYDRYERLYRFLRDQMHADTLIRDRNNMTAQDWWDRPTELEEDGENHD